MEQIGPPTALLILDVGCGDGMLVAKLASLGAEVTGCDASETMIAAAQQRAGDEGKDIRFEVAQAEALPFGSGTFDVVVAVTVLCFVENAPDALREMARVLKPGGRLILGELNRFSSWAAIRRIKGWLGSSTWRRARFRTRSELKRLATGAGLVDISVTGAIHYPPMGIAASLMGSFDRLLGKWTTGAAFIMVTSTKPLQARS